jgi:threonine synthase
MPGLKEKISHVSHLQCSVCEKTFAADQINTYAYCEKCEKNPLVAHYDFFSGYLKENINKSERSMWRYFEMLPVFDQKNIVSLGEGWTPLLSLKKLGAELGITSLLMKDESLNPTGSFKARGLSAAISKAKELGIQNCIIPTAGNAGGAMAAYCAKADIKATVVMPKHTPKAFQQECRLFGAELILVDGLISDCAKKVAELNSKGNYFDVSTMKEPYRLEGKKTMGYEIAEQLNWVLPDVILYPTGGGTGLIGMWKAFHEMIEMGWISNKLPRMIAVQTENCQPMVELFQFNKVKSPCTPTIANGLAVPTPFAHRMIQQVLKESNGTALAVSDDEIIDSTKALARQEGLLIAPEGAALVVALRKMIHQGAIDGNSKTLLLNTGSAYKYFENLPID